MFGAVIGDILGSVYEGGQAAKRNVPFFIEGLQFTDDTVCTIAVCEAILDGHDFAESLRKWGNQHPNAGYGGTFRQWLRNPGAGPYQSFANGSLMRVSPAVALASTLEEAQAQARAATAVTHDHEVSFKAVQAYTSALWAALKGKSAREACAIIEGAGYSAHDVEIQHEAGRFSLRADETLEDVLSCLKNADSFESLMRECFYHGGDTDTICAIAGPLGEVLWGIPEDIVNRVMELVPLPMIDILTREYDIIEKYNRR